MSFLAAISMMNRVEFWWYKPKLPLLFNFYSPDKQFDCLWTYAVKAEVALRATSMNLILKSLESGTDVANYEKEDYQKPRMTVNTPLHNLRTLAYELFPSSGKSCAWENWDYDFKTWKKTKRGIKRLVKLYHSNALETYKAETHYDEYLYGKYYKLKKTRWLKGEPMCFGVVMCKRILS